LHLIIAFNHFEGGKFILALALQFGFPSTKNFEKIDGRPW